MTITIDTFTCSALLAQPFTYEGDARTGLTARTFRISGLLTAEEWTALIGVYDSWRDARITDEDTIKSGVVGTTVNVSIDSCNGLTVTSLPCWFADPPDGTQAGSYISATVTMVDAEQALAVLLREKEKSEQAAEGEKPDLGTVQLGSAVITLTKPMDTRQDGPQVAMSATGASYITGALVAHKVRQIEGYISTGTYEDVLNWYDTTIAAAANTGVWFPTGAPNATAEAVITDGVKSTKYNISVTAVEII